MKKLFGIAILVMIASQIVAWRLSPDTYGTDLFPLWWAAQRLFQGEVVYGPEATVALAQAWGASEPYASGGMAYPIPLILIAAPLALLPFGMAVIIYNALGFLGLLLGLQRLNPAAVWFLPTPAMILGLALGQTSILILAGMVWWLIALRAKRWDWVAILALFVLLKPNVGFLVWGWTAFQMVRQRSSIPSKARFIFVGGTLAGCISLLFWGQPWLQQVQVYDQAINTNAFPTATLVILGGLSLLTGPWTGFVFSPLTQWFAYYPVAAWDTMLLTQSSRKLNYLWWVLIIASFFTNNYGVYAIAAAVALLKAYQNWRDQPAKQPAATGPSPTNPHGDIEL